MKFSFLRSAAAAAALVAVSGVASAANYQSFAAGVGPITAVTGFTSSTTSVTDNYLMPQAPAGSTITSYSYLSPKTSTTGTISFASALNSYTFLWGSPDQGNVLSGGSITVNGQALTGHAGQGSNTESQLYTYTSSTPFTSLTFQTSVIAFEVAAVTPVPEPETYALMIAGLGVVGMLARRRRAA